MPEQNQITLQQRKKSLGVRGALLIVQILLPFGLYLALRGSNSLAAVLIAAGFFLSMLFLVWLG
jgi:hypothetical protein